MRRDALLFVVVVLVMLGLTVFAIAQATAGCRHAGRATVCDWAGAVPTCRCDR